MRTNSLNGTGCVIVVMIVMLRASAVDEKVASCRSLAQKDM
jgi:hypothetical protein